MKKIQEVTKDFLKSILLVIASNSSKSYGIYILKNLKKKLINDFPVFNLIEFDNNDIQIDIKIKSADTKEVSKLFNKIIDMLGPDILKLFLKEHMDSYDIKYLNKIGVRF